MSTLNRSGDAHIRAFIATPIARMWASALRSDSWPRCKARLWWRLAKSLLCWVCLAGLAVLPTPAVFGQTTTNPPAASNRDAQPSLPVVFLEAKEQIVSDRKVPCTLKLAGPAGAGRNEAGPWSGVVRIHGGVSQGFPKKSFSITLDQPAPLLDLRPHGHWILNAAYIDRSLMRHKLSYDLFRSLSTAGASRAAAASRFVEVHLNGSYHGAYLLMERVDKQLLGLRPYRSNEVNHACLYKAVDHAANFGQAGNAGYEQREPDPTARTYWEPLESFNRFVASTPDGAFFHPETGIASRLDLDNAMDFHLLVLLTSNGDGITKNFFLGRQGPAAGVPNPRFFFAPWDYDGTFGQNWDASAVPPSAWLSNHLFDRLLSHAPYRAKFVARWNHLRDREFSVKTIHALMDANVRTLGGAARRNATRWPTRHGPYPDELSFEEDVAEMKSWVEARIKWLDREINQNLGRHY